MKVLKSHQNFGGTVQFHEHESKSTGTKMKFSTFLPRGEIKGGLIWLSGLTCTDENFITKAGAQKYLAEAGLMVICPDTSPRGLNLPNEHDAYDFGSGAGFYVNATTDFYKDHYRMYDYVVNDIYDILQTEFKVGAQVGIFGHSMGGHGALIIGLREPGKFKSVSAFAPIVNPVKAAWGQKAFTGYLGSDQKTWSAFDATELLAAGRLHPKPILIDQGTADEFLEKQLLTRNFKSPQQEIKMRFQDGYDHSYYFMATFIEDHVRFHAQNMA